MLSTGTPALTVITTSEQSSSWVEQESCFYSNINKKKNRSTFHATVSIRYQTNKSNLEQLFQSPGAVTNALNRHAGFDCYHNKRTIISSRGASKLFLNQHQEKEKPQRFPRYGFYTLPY